MKRLGEIILPCAAAAALAASAGCSEDTFLGATTPNEPPKIRLTSGPVERETTTYKLKFSWDGYDPDGHVDRYEFVICDGDPIGFDPSDTAGVDKWTATTRTDSLFRFTADDFDATYRIGTAWYTRYKKTHTFFVRAVDDQGMRSDAAHRSFTAWTLAPSVYIDEPGLPGSGTLCTLSRVVRFAWTGSDPIDAPGNTQDPDSVRYLYTKVVDSTGQYNPTFPIIDDINRNPGRYEKKWSRWIWYRAPGDSGRSTILGDDETLELNRQYIFALQAKDEAGAVSAVLDAKTNVRRFFVSWNAGPLLKITEPFLGGFVFLGTNLRPQSRELPPGVPLSFRWRADASDYGGVVSCYRYGWDIRDVNDPSEWAVLCSPYNLTTTRTLYAGTHTLFIEARDNSGTVTLAQIEINVVPFTMDLNLLWVDDYYAEELNMKDPDYSYTSPSLSNFKNFWIGQCQKADGFDPARDVYVVAQEHNKVPPSMSLIGRYKNIIWSFTTSPDDMAWDNLVAFTPESQINAGSKLTVNYLPLFLAKGGHLLTEGRSDRGGGLAAAIPENSRLFPLGLRCEITGPTEGCAGDTSGVYSMPYRDYCITMIDKVDGMFRSPWSYHDMPKRQVASFDCMVVGLKASDPVTDAAAGLPDSLALWSSVVAPGKFFDFDRANPGGFTYVEIYDPAYWMSRDMLRSQACFHPMYRMRARDKHSALDNQTFAIWLTKYESITPDVVSGVAVAAPSAHFGTELWFFNRTQVNAVTDVLFGKWRILK